MTPKGCGICEALEEHPQDAVVTDESGGSFTRTCRDCRARLEERGRIFKEDICVFCTSKASGGKAEYLYFLDDEQEPVFNICDDCRVSIAFEDGPTEIVVVR